jgi:hypothetical protein
MEMQIHQYLVGAIFPVQDGGKSGNSAIDPSSAYRFNPAQKEAIQSLLSKANGWRIALPSDNHNSDLEQFQKENPGYTPYYVESDLTGDGKKDFVIAVIHGKYFGIVFFRAEGDHYSAPQWLTRDGELSDDGIFVKERELWVGPFYSDFLDVYVWSAKAKKLVRQL